MHYVDHRKYSLQCVICLSPTDNFIAFLGFMTKPAANYPLNPGMMSDQQNPHTGINPMTALSETVLKQVLCGHIA